LVNRAALVHPTALVYPNPGFVVFLIQTALQQGLRIRQRANTRRRPDEQQGRGSDHSSLLTF
jgi:hypothetical protein